MVIPGVGVLYNLWIDNQNWNCWTLQNCATDLNLL